MTYTILELFKNLFASSGEGYLVDGDFEAGQVTTSDYSRHLSGEAPLAASPFNARFAMARVKKGKVNPLSPIIEFKHDKYSWAVLFLKEKYSKPFVQLKRIADYYLLELDETDFIGLPFFNAQLDFYPVNTNGNKFRLVEEALEYCATKAVSVRQIDEWEKNLPFSDAPFCIQSYYMVNGTLPSFANPYLDAKELPIENKSDATWWKKFTAPYDCSGKPCNKEKCLGRKFGLKSGEVSEVEFGNLTQYIEEPVFYEWTINGKQMKFYNETDIINQDKFLRLCMRDLGFLPKKLKGERWLKIINKALSNMKIVGEKETAKLTIDKMIEIITKELSDRILVSTYYEYERLMQGYIYLDPTSSVFVILPSAFCSYITGRFQDLRIDSATDFYAVLKHLGFRGRRKAIEGVDRTLLFARSRFLFRTDEDWTTFMLKVSKDTIWEDNFKAFLLGDTQTESTVEEATREEIMQDVALYLDTEKE